MKHDWLIDTGRRALLTAAQVAAGYIAASPVIGGVDWVGLLLAVLLAVAVTLLKALIVGGWAGQLTSWAQIIERVAATAAQAALGVIGSAVILTEVDWRLVAGTAATAAALSVLTHVRGLMGEVITVEVVPTGAGDPAPRNAVDKDGDGRPDYA